MDELTWACRAADVIDEISQRAGWVDGGGEYEYLPSVPPCLPTGQRTDMDHLCHGTLITSEMEIFPPEVECDAVFEYDGPDVATMDLAWLKTLGQTNPGNVLDKIDFIESIRQPVACGRGWRDELAVGSTF